MTMILRNYRCKQFYITSNGINPPSGLKIWVPQSLAQVLPHLTSFGPWASAYGANGQITMTVHNHKSRQIHKTFNWANSVQWFQRSAFRKVWTRFVSNFTSFFVHGQAHMGQMGLDNSTELRMEKIRRAVTDIWVPQVWQPPTRPPARTVTTIPLHPEGLRGKRGYELLNLRALKSQHCMKICLFLLSLFVWNFKVSFEIAHKTPYTYIERCVFHSEVNI